MVGPKYNPRMPVVAKHPINFLRRELARCKRCKKSFQRSVRVTGERVETEHLGRLDSRTHTETFTEDGRRIGSFAAPECCGRILCFEAISGRKVPEVKCGARCTSAVGPSCDCACGGANHGAGHAHI